MNLTLELTTEQKDLLDQYFGDFEEHLKLTVARALTQQTRDNANAAALAGVTPVDDIDPETLNITMN